MIYLIRWVYFSTSKYYLKNIELKSIVLFSVKQLNMLFNVEMYWYLQYNILWNAKNSKMDGEAPLAIPVNTQFVATFL